MAETTTITVRVTAETKRKLDQLAEVTRRSRSFHAAEAIDAYADHELAVVAGLLKGLDDAKTGRVIPHETAMAELRDHVRNTSAKSRRKSA